MAMLNRGRGRSVGNTAIVLTACHPVPPLNVYIYMHQLRSVFTPLRTRDAQAMCGRWHRAPATRHRVHVRLESTSSSSKLQLRCSSLPICLGGSRVVVRQNGYGTCCLHKGSGLGPSSTHAPATLRFHTASHTGCSSDAWALAQGTCDTASCACQASIEKLFIKTATPLLFTNRTDEGSIPEVYQLTPQK